MSRACAQARAFASINPMWSAQIMDYLLQLPVLLFASMMLIFGIAMIAVCVTDSRLR